MPGRPKYMPIYIYFFGVVNFTAISKIINLKINKRGVGISSGGVDKKSKINKRGPPVYSAPESRNVEEEFRFAKNHL